MAEVHGNRTPAENAGTNAVRDEGGAESGAVGERHDPAEADLRVVVQSWPKLPDNIKTDDSAAVPGTKVLVGEARDIPVTTLTTDLALQLDDNYPGAGNYLIKRLPERRTIAILGVDADGVGRGVRNWCAFLKPQGHWLLNQ